MHIVDFLQNICYNNLTLKVKRKVVANMFNLGLTANYIIISLESIKDIVDCNGQCAVYDSDVIFNRLESLQNKYFDILDFYDCNCDNENSKGKEMFKHLIDIAALDNPPFASEASMSVDSFMKTLDDLIIHIKEIASLSENTKT